MPKSQVNVRLDDSLLTDARAESERRGVTLTDLISEALYATLYGEAQPSEEGELLSDRVAKLEAAIQRVAPVLYGEGAPTSGLLTTAEALAELKRRGHPMSNPTLGRKLRAGTVPSDLKRLGLVIDPAGWLLRAENPASRVVRWLKFETLAV